jgi:tRNA(fMet)-specific endonuclease VapC
VSFLLDTDICSAYLRGNARVNHRFIQYGGRLHVSTVTQGELFVWALRAKASPRRSQSLLDFLKEVVTLLIDEAAARKFGEVRAWQLDHGLATPDLDLLNASVALAHGSNLVTHNVSDYANIPGLTVDDWLTP